MAMYQIKSWLNGSVLFECDVPDTNSGMAARFSLEKATQSRADLSGANLFRADLSGANLSGADLSGAKIDGEEIKKPPVQIGGLTWHVLITESFMRIGCQRHSHADWAGFDAIAIGNMADGAVEFWGQWKSILLSMCASHAIDKN